MEEQPTQEEQKPKEQKPNLLAAAGPNSIYQLPGAVPAGFLVGFWHGIIAPITFIISLFNPSVRIYETNNNGRLYDFGFMLGIGALSGGHRVVIK